MIGVQIWPKEIFQLTKENILERKVMFEKEFCVERTIDGEEHELTLKITFNIESFQEGRCFGPPELCYPDDGGTANVKEILLDTKNSSSQLFNVGLVNEDGTEKWTGSLTKEEEDEFCQSAYEAWCQEENERIEEAAIDSYEARMEFHEERVMANSGKGEVY